MSVNRLQGFPAGELPVAALLAQLPVAVDGRVGIAIPDLFNAMFLEHHVEQVDFPFDGPEGFFFVRIMEGMTVTAAIGPDTNVPVRGAAFARLTGPILVAVDCRDPFMGMLVGTGKALPATEASALGIADTAGAAAAHTMIQGCFNRLTNFVQSVATANPDRQIVLTGHGTGGYFALALRCLLNSQVVRAYAFDAPSHGLKATFPPTGGDVDDHVLEVRFIGADNRHEMEPALGRRLLVDAASFGFRRPGPMEQGPGRNTRLDRGLRRLTGDRRPDPLVGPLLSVGGDAPGQIQLNAGHPARNLLWMLGAHLGQTGQAGSVLRLARHYDGSVRVDIPGTVASATATPARAVRFEPAGTVMVGAVPQSTLHVSTGRAWGGGTSTILSIQPWDGGAYALDRSINPATGLLADEAGDVTAAALLSGLFGGETQVDLAPVATPAEQLAAAWRQRGAWIDPGIGISVTPDLRPLLRGGILEPGSSLLGVEGGSVNVIGSIIGDVRAKVGAALDTCLGVGNGGYAHAAALAVGDAGSLLSLCTLAIIVRGLDLAGAEQMAPASLSTLLVEASSRIVSSRLGAAAHISPVAAWQAALEATKAGNDKVFLSEVWLLSDPMDADGATFGSALAGVTPAPSVLANLAGLLALALQSAAIVAPPAVGYADCTVGGLSPSVDRSGFNGPPEVLTASVLGLAGVGQKLTSFIATELGVDSTDLPAIRLWQQSGNDGVSLSGGGPVQTGTRSDVLRLLIARLLAGMAGKVESGEPVLAALLMRGWIDWLILAKEPRLRTAMPRLPAVYAFFDQIAEAQGLLATQPAATLVPVTRPPMGKDAFIVGGLLYELRRIATDLVARSGEPATVFNSLVQMVEHLPTLGEQMGLPPSEIPSFPTPPATAVQRLQQWLSATAGLSETVFGYAIATGGVAVPVPLGFNAVQSDTATSNGAAIGGIKVSWTALGPGDTALIRWKEKGTASWLMTTQDAQATQYMISSLVGGRTYLVAMARRTADSRESPYTASVEITLKTGLEGARVAGLKLTGPEPTTTWTGRDVAIEWRGTFPASLIDATSGLAITPEAYLSGYVVRIYNAATNVLLREEPPTRKTAYTYNYDLNAGDSRTLGLPSACRELLFKVAILPTVGPELGEQSIIVSNPPPPQVQVTAEAGVGLLAIDVTPVSDLDLDGYAIWISDQPDFDPAMVAPTYRGPSPHYVQKNLKIGNWYVRAAAVDLFQPRDHLDVAGLNLSTQIAVTLADITVDKVPPAVPAGLTLDSEVAIATSGEQVVTLTARWDRNTEPDFLLYEGQIRQGETGAWTDFSLGLPADGLPTQSWPVCPETAYAVRLRARDRSSNASGYCAEVQVQTLKDPFPPGPVTNLAAIPSFRTVALSWTNPDDDDLDHVEIWVNHEDDRDGAALLGVTYGTTLSDTGLATGEPRCYWARAVDTTGNIGPWNDVAGVPAITGTIAKADTEPGPPATPAGLVLSQQTTQTADGMQLIKLLADWADNDEDDFSHYEYQFARFDTANGAWGPWRSGLTGDSRMETVVESGYRYKVRVRAFDFVSNASEFTQSVELLIVGDTVAPGVPTDLKVTAGTKTITLEWVNPTDSDWFEAEIRMHSGLVPNFANAVRATRVSMDKWVFATPALGTTYQFWVCARDVTGNASAFAGPIPAQTLAVETADFVTGSIDAGVISAGSITAGLLEVSSRTMTVENLVFEANTNAAGVTTNTVSWRGVGGDTPRLVFRAPGGDRRLTISTGQAEWSTGTVLYLYIADPGSNGTVQIQSSPDYATASGTGKVILASYAGGQKLVATYGTTIISDELIQTNAIRASHIQANAIKSRLIETNELTADIVRIGPEGLEALSSLFTPTKTTIDGAKITTGSITAAQLEIRSTTFSTTIQFTPKAGGKNGHLAWSAGAIYYPRQTQQADILARDAAALGSGHVTWDVAATTLVGGRTMAEAYNNADRLVLGYWDATHNIWTPAGSGGTIINGDQIQTGSITADRLDIGAGKVSSTIRFSPKAGNVPGALTWSQGKITYGQGGISPDISARNITTALPSGYITWGKSDTTLTTGQSAAVAFGADRIVLGYWDQGDSRWFPNAGSTVINADQIQTGAITASLVKIQPSGDMALDSLFTPNETTIDGGKITAGTVIASQIKVQASGSTTLDSLFTPNETTIDGGKITAGSISAGKLTISSQGVQIDRLDFKVNYDTITKVSILSWNWGRVIYTDDAGIVQQSEILPGSYTYTDLENGQPYDATYVIWTKAAITLTTTKHRSIAGAANNVIVGVFYGGTNWTELYGRTIITGDRIQTGAIDANKLVTDQAVITQSAQIARAIINDAHINNLEAKKITTGSLSADVRISVGNTTKGPRVQLGWFGTGAQDCGLIVRDANGDEVVTLNGLGLKVVGTGQIVPGSITNSAQSTAASGNLTVIGNTTIATQTITHNGKKVRLEVSGSGTVVTMNTNSTTKSGRISVRLYRGTTEIAYFGDVVARNGVDDGDDTGYAGGSLACTYIDQPSGTQDTYSLVLNRNGGQSVSYSNVRLVVTALYTEG